MPAWSCASGSTSISGSTGCSRKRLSTQPSVRGLRRGEAGHVDASLAIAVLDQRGSSVGPSDGHAHASGNPHYWLDPKNAEIITRQYSSTRWRASIIRPTRPLTRPIAWAFLARLEERSCWEWDAQLAPLQGAPMVAYHNSWAYLARRFRLNFIGSSSRSPAFRRARRISPP